MALQPWHVVDKAKLVRDSLCCLRIAGFTTPTGWLGTHRAVSALLYFRVSATPRLISFITCVAFCNNHCMLHQNANICHKKIQFSPDNEFHGCDKLTIAIIMSTYVVGCGHLKQKQNNTFTMCNVITILIRVVRLLHELIKLANRINTGENHAIGMSTIFIVVFFFNCNRWGYHLSCTLRTGRVIARPFNTQPAHVPCTPRTRTSTHRVYTTDIFTQSHALRLGKTHIPVSPPTVFGKIRIHVLRSKKVYIINYDVGLR